MGNVAGSVFSGIGQVVGNIFGHPLDFLSGKSCDTICRPTWDFVCYIENFCVGHLLKFFMVATLVYLVLLFFYLVYQLGICQCICHSCCRIIWACCANYFSLLNFCCSYLCYKLRTVKRKRRGRRKRDIEEEIGAMSSDISSESGDDFAVQQHRNLGNTRTRATMGRNYKEEHLRRSLRPTSHRARLGIAHSSIHSRRRKSINNVDDRTDHLHHHIRVTRSSRFAQKGSRHRSGIRHRKR